MTVSFAGKKVNNEIELCEVNDPDCKKIIEKEFLKNRISYFIRWGKMFSLSKNHIRCIFCVNDNFQEQASQIVNEVCEENGFQVKLLLRRAGR